MHLVWDIFFMRPTLLGISFLIEIHSKQDVFRDSVWERIIEWDWLWHREEFAGRVEDVWTLFLLTCSVFIKETNRKTGERERKGEKGHEPVNWRLCYKVCTSQMCARGCHEKRFGITCITWVLKEWGNGWLEATRHTQPLGRHHARLLFAGNWTNLDFPNFVLSGLIRMQG